MHEITSLPDLRVGCFDKSLLDDINSLLELNNGQKDTRFQYDTFFNLTDYYAFKHKYFL